MTIPTADDPAPPTDTTSAVVDRAHLQGLGGLGYKPESVRLKSLVLDNFKSFASRVVIDLRQGFTAISGPNGSGKSNLIDAMLFVLGFASSKGLRADRLTDFINTESGKPVARVSLELEVVTDRGETRNLEVSRVVRRKSSGYDAHYELDGEEVRMHDLHEVLRDLGLPSSGINVVVQNDVTRITALGEVSRRKILDELAGAEEFDHRIKAANGELGQADTHQGEIKIVLAEINARLVVLEKEKEQALAYQALHVEKERLEAELFVLDVLEAQARARKKADEVEAHGDRAAELKDELAQAERDSEEASKALAAVEAEIAAKHEGERLAAVREVEALKTNVAHTRAGADAARAEAGAIQGRNGERQGAFDGAVAREQALGLREEQLKAELEAKTGLHGTLRREVDRDSAEVQARVKGTLDAAEAQRAWIREADGVRERESQTATALRSAGERVARGTAERAMILQALESDRARKFEVERSAAEAASARRIAREDEASEDERIRKLIQRSQQLRAGLEKLDHDLHSGTSELARLDERRKAALDHSGGRGLDALRRDGLAGLHGPVHQLLRFEVDQALAIEAAAGARLTHLVVDDERAAKTGIEILKRANAGRMTFYPLTKIQPPRVDLRPVQGRGVLGYALELVQYDEVYEPVMRLVFGETIVVETMQAAIELGIGRHRMVTLDGEQFERTGAMTGGAASSRGTILAQAARSEQEIQQRQAGIDELRRRRDAARAELEKVDAEGRSAQALHGARKTKLGEATSLAEQLHAELARLESKIAPAEKRLAELDTDLAHAQGEIRALEAELARLREALGQAQGRLQSTPVSGHEALEALEQEHQKREKSMRELEAAMGELKEQLTLVQLERRDALAAIEAARRAIDEAAVAASGALARAAEGDAETGRLSGELAQKERKIAHLMDELRELSEKRDEARGYAQDVRDGAKELARLLDAELKALEEARKLFAELDGLARSLSALAAEKKLVLPPVLEAPAEEGEKKRRRRVPAADAAEIPEGAIRAGELGKLRDVARRELARTEGKMKALEPVNMKAIEHHAEFSARKAELDERLATLEREVGAIRARIVELEGAKRTSFLQAFEAVAAAFKENFRELTQGEGWLSLTNPDDPFAGGLTITARPRNQKAARLESLSGGEKTLTALAFLFALQEINTAPFFVFDEVDASLDGVNTGRLADAIRRRSDRRQYFVVSHRRALVEKAHQAIGVTKRKGIGTVVAGITLEEVAAVEAAVEAERRAAQAKARAAQPQAPATSRN